MVKAFLCLVQAFRNAQTCAPQGNWAVEPYGRAHVCIGWQLVYQACLGLAWLWAALGQLSLPVHLEGLESLHQHINCQNNYMGKERNTKSKDTGDYA